MDRETKALVQAALSRLAIPTLVNLVRPVHDAILQRYPLARGPNEDYLNDPLKYGPRDSGILWDIEFDSFGLHVPSSLLDHPSTRPRATRKWEIGMSFRGPLFVASEWSINDGRVHEINPQLGVDLLAWAQALASRFGLSYVEGAELMAWQVDAEQMTEEMWGRLDHTDYPNAFQLLFSEDG
jgi:hypothetical protein